MERNKYYYVDTAYLLSYLYQTKMQYMRGFDIDPEQVRTARSVMGFLNAENIKIPVFVIAEAAAKSAEKSSMMSVVDLTAGFETAWLSRDRLNDFCKTVEEISENDPRLEPMDCLIASLALVNDECCGLLTFDRVLINNRVIYRLSKKYGKEGSFVVTDDPRKF